MAPAGQGTDCARNIRLLSLPPYSPELNPMENVWDYLQQNKLCAQVWDIYDDILEACKNAISCSSRHHGRVRGGGSAVYHPDLRCFGREPAWPSCM
jgi:hypothetical protein